MKGSNYLMEIKVTSVTVLILLAIQASFYNKISKKRSGNATASPAYCTIYA